jgi:hypothetical protein
MTSGKSDAPTPRMVTALSEASTRFSNEVNASLEDRKTNLSKTLNKTTDTKPDKVMDLFRGFSIADVAQDAGHGIIDKVVSPAKRINP